MRELPYYLNYPYLYYMKTSEKNIINPSIELTDEEEQHMVLIQKTIDKGEYRPIPDKEQIMKGAVTLSRRESRH